MSALWPVLAATVFALRAVGDRGHRLFWGAWAGAALCRAAVELLGAEPLPLRHAVLVLAYLFAVSAVERATSAARTFPEWPEGLFVLALALYFLGPAPADPRSESFFRCLLDAYLAGRLLLLVLSRRGRLRRRTYGALAAAHALLLAADAWAGSPLLRGVAFAVLALAAFGRADDGIAWRHDSRASFLRSVRTLAFGVAFPFLHIAADRVHVLAASHRGEREVVAVVCLVTFGVIALLQHRAQEHEGQRLWLERRAFEERLKSNEQDLRLIVEQQRALQIARRSEQRFSTAFNACPYALVVSNLVDGRFAEVNPAFEELFGWRRDEVCGRTFRDLDLWADPADAAGVTAEIDEEGEVSRRPTVLRRRDGDLRHVLLSAKTVTLRQADASGTPAAVPCLITILRDVTEQEEEQKRLLVGIALLRGSSDAIAVVDGDDRIRFWNDAAELLFGLASADVLGRPWDALSDMTQEAAGAREARDEARRHGSCRGELFPPRAAASGGLGPRLDGWWIRVDSPDEPVGTLLLVCREAAA